MDANLRDWATFEDFICERDGAFRDINFKNPTWNGVRNLVGHFAEKYQQKPITDENGSVKKVLPSVVVDAARHSGGLSVSYQSGGSWISEFQVFFGIKDEKSPFVEVSFHPDDVIHAGDMRPTFLAWADDIRLLLNADSFSYG